MSLYSRPEKYAANPPATWTVARLGRDRFAVIVEPGGVPADTHNTRADAQRVIDRPDSWLRRRYEKEAAAVRSGEAMQCAHPLGFTVLRGPIATCFDCKAESPGRCVCGAMYRDPACQIRAHMNGPRFAPEPVYEGNAA